MTYTIRRYRMETIGDAPMLIDETTSDYLDAIYADTGADNRVVVLAAPGEIDIYHCPTPMHLIAMLAVVYATEHEEVRR